MALFFGILVLVLLLWALNGFTKADPKLLAKVLGPVGGSLALTAAGFLFFRGQIEIATPSSGGTVVTLRLPVPG